MTRKSKRNIRLYYLFRIFGTMNLTMPIFVLFLIDNGLTGFQIFISQGAYTITELLLTVPSGAFADKVGRKKTLLISNTIYAACFALYGFADTFVQILLIEIHWAVSSAMFHGTGEAFMYDTLAEAKQKKKYKKVMGNAYAIQSVVMGSCAIAGGYIGKMDLGLPFTISALPMLVSLVPLMFIEEPKRKKTEEMPYLNLMKEATAYSVKKRELRNIMYYVGITTLASYMGFMLYQPILKDMGVKLEYIGFIIMTIFIAHSIGNKIAHKFEEKSGFMDLMMCFAGIMGIMYLLVYLGTGTYIIMWALFIDLFTGMSTTLVSDWTNRHSGSKNRATVLSISMMPGSLMFSVFSPLFGLYVDAYSAQSAFGLFGLMLVAYALRQAGMMLLGKKVIV